MTSICQLGQLSMVKLLYWMGGWVDGLGGWEIQKLSNSEGLVGKNKYEYDVSLYNFKCCFISNISSLIFWLYFHSVKCPATKPIVTYQKSSFIGQSNFNDNRKGGIHFYTGNLFRSSGITVEKILAKRSRLQINVLSC